VGGRDEGDVVGRPRWTVVVMSSAVAFQMKGLRSALQCAAQVVDRFGGVGTVGEHASVQAPVGEVLESVLGEVRP
jgi:hypothetical protein